MDEDEDPRRAFPPDARMSEWRAPDGFALRRMDWLQDQDAAPRGSLLFAGGRGDFIEKYLEAHRHWHAGGWNVTTFDWRGQGASRGDIAGGNLASFDPLVDDLAAMIAAWRDEMPGPHVAVAHSMGGHLLLRALVERRPDLDAAVLVAPMIRVNSWPLPARLGPPIARLLCRLGLSDRPMAKTPRMMSEKGASREYYLTGSPERYQDELWWWEREPGYRLGLPSWGWIRAAYRSAATAFTANKLAEVSVPLLLLGTARDRLVSPAAIHDAAEKLPDAVLHIYPDAGHEILREDDPVRLDALARIDAFFDERAP